MNVTFLAPLVNQITASKLKLHKMFVQSPYSYFTFYKNYINPKCTFLKIHCHTSH